MSKYKTGRIIKIDNDGDYIYKISELKEIIKALVDVNLYPDIRFYEESGFSDDIYITGELIFCTGEVIKIQQKVDGYMLKKQPKVKEIMIDNMLRQIGYLYVKRAYDKKNKSIAVSYSFFIKDLLRRNNNDKK